MSQGFTLSAAERPPPLDIGGFMVTILASTQTTGGYEIFHQCGPEGAGPGPHFHPWDESFFVLRGELHCGIDASETVAGPGTLIHVPGGATHWFRFGVGGGELLALTARGNASAMFTDYADGVNWSNPDRSQLVALAARHGQTILG